MNTLNSRYQQHLTLPHIGIEGQKKLNAARVLVIGAGGLGAPALMYLAATGIGTLGIIDSDKVELSNLQRQILYREDQIGMAKVTAAAQNLSALNSEITIEPHNVRLHNDNAMNLLQSYDVIVDGSDNFTTRYLINDICVQLKKPWVQASVHQFTGQCVVFTPQTPCYRCLFPEPDLTCLNCADAGVLGVLPGILGTLQANEVIKLILGLGESLAGSLLTIDALSLHFQQLKLSRDPHCITCQQKNASHDVIRRGITSAELHQRLQQQESLCLIDVREPDEYDEFHIPHSRNIPLKTLPEHLSQLSQTDPIILLCARGQRSEYARQLLQQHGITGALSLVGGLIELCFYFPMDFRNSDSKIE